MTYRIPTERWNSDDLAAGCGYALINQPLAEKWMRAPAVAGGWIAVDAPIMYLGGLRDEIVKALDPVSVHDEGGFSARANATARALENWPDNGSQLYVAALPSAMMEGRKMPLTADEAERVAALINARYERHDALVNA